MEPGLIQDEILHERNEEGNDQLMILILQDDTISSDLLQVKVSGNVCPLLTTLIALVYHVSTC